MMTDPHDADADDDLFAARDNRPDEPHHRALPRRPPAPVRR